MSNVYNLLVESPCYELKYLVEEQNRNAPSTLKVKGPFLMANKPNRNNRVYPLEQMVEEVNRYTSEMIVNNRATGELNHPSCNSKDADILTQNGWKSIVDVKKDDVIPTLNISTGEIELHPVKKKIDQPYKGKMYRLVGRNIDVKVTPNHRFPLVHRYGKKDLVEIQEIYNNRKKYSKSYIPKLGDWFSDVTEIIIPKFTETNPNLHENPVDQDLIIPSNIFSKFMGIWLSEGWTSTRNENSRGYIVGISQKKENIVNSIRELLKEFPIKWSERISNGTTTFWVSDARLFTFLHKLGDCYNKYIPEEVKNFSAEDLEELIYWFNLGDGRFSTTCHENGYIQRNVFSVSKRLIDDLQECLLKSGGCGNITTIITEADYTFSDHIIKTENKVPLYQLNIATTKGIYLDDRFLKIEEIEFDENVYCVTVQNETFYCRENGKAFWSGNSPEVNLERACHIVTELKQNGDIFEGTSKILSTPMGQIVRSLIMDGVKLGVSSRALGRVEPNKSGVGMVSDFRLVAIDVVADPSVPTAFVNGILESKQWVLSDNGELEPFYENFEKKISNLPKHNSKQYLKECLIDFINKLKTI